MLYSSIGVKKAENQRNKNPEYDKGLGKLKILVKTGSDFPNINTYLIFQNGKCIPSKTTIISTNSKRNWDQDLIIPFKSLNESLEIQCSFF